MKRKWCHLVASSECVNKLKVPGFANIIDINEINVLIVHFCDFEFPRWKYVYYIVYILSSKPNCVSSFSMVGFSIFVSTRQNPAWFLFFVFFYSIDVVDNAPTNLMI